MVSHYLNEAQFSCASVDGHLRCVLFLSILSKGALNILAQGFNGHRHSVLSGTQLGVEFLGCSVNML